MQVIIMSKHQNILIQDHRNVELGESQEFIFPSKWPTV